MEQSNTTTRKKRRTTSESTSLHFDVSTGLKRVLGQELITNNEVAIFELVKNSFDAGANSVHLYFGPDSVIVADNGSGMSFEDLREKWLFVAYSEKRNSRAKDFRQVAADRTFYAGSKGIGRFSSDRIGTQVILQTRERRARSKTVHRLTIDWGRFEQDDKQHFETVPVSYERKNSFVLPTGFRLSETQLKHGTIVEIRNLREHWDRASLQDLKASLAKLINPFGSDVDKFRITITAPAELEEDKKIKREAKAEGEEPSARGLVNGKVGNFVFSDLQEKTTFITVSIEGHHLTTTVVDRGELIYRIREPSPYKLLAKSGFRCELYYLNHSAKLTFARRVGLPSVQFGSLFLFRNDIRVYPIGEAENDWFGFDRRKQQGYARFLGTREIIGRVDVYGSDLDFQEASSRNQGLIETPAVRELQKCIMEHCLKRLEKYVVPVSWVDKGDAKTDNISRLLTDPGRARVTAAIASLVDNTDIQLVDYSKRLVGIINERSSEFESSLVGLRSIAEKTDDKKLLTKLDAAERRFEELRKSEEEARKVADRERAAATAAAERAEAAENKAESAKAEADIERRRAHFLESVVSLDTATILNLHHQVTIYAVDIAQQIENLLADTEGKKTIPRAQVMQSLEQMAFLNHKVLAVTRFAPRATFKLDSEKIEADLSEFIIDYIENITRGLGSARPRVEVEPDENLEWKARFNPIDVSIIVDNLVSNAKKARASRVKFMVSAPSKNELMIHISDNGRGVAKDVNRRRLFDMGYTMTRGSGLGLYHVKQILGEMRGTIELDDPQPSSGASFTIRISRGRPSKK